VLSSTKSRLIEGLEMIQFLFLVSRQGKVRLAKWYTTVSDKEKTKIMRDCSAIAIARTVKFCNFVQYRSDVKIVCKRYASLYFIAGIDADENELITLEVIHHFVEVLDKYFGNVCELDIIFNFHKAYYVLDEVLLGGELQESSKKTILKFIGLHDSMAEEGELNMNSTASIVAATVQAAIGGK
jgi:AP-1 complex subunit sigma 1/2